MKWKTCHLWMLIGICISYVLDVYSFDFEKTRTRNTTSVLEDLPIFEKAEVPIFIIGDKDRVPLLETRKSNKSQKNDIAQSSHIEIKNSASKIYNIKKHSGKPEKSHAKRENFFFRLFSDNYKPHKARLINKKRRDVSGIRKLESLNLNSTMYPAIPPHPVIPFSHFGRDRKMDDDKICKTQIIKFFPKQIRKTYETKNEFGNGSHKQMSFNDNNNEWELRQDIFVEEVLPFREKNDFGFKDMFHDEAKTIFDDILSIFTMLPFTLFDSVYVKVSTTEKPKLSIIRENTEKSDYDDAAYFIDNLRKRRQATPLNGVSVPSDSNVLKQATPFNGSSVSSVSSVSNVSKLTETVEHAKDSHLIDSANRNFTNSTNKDKEVVSPKSAEHIEMTKNDKNATSEITINAKTGTNVTLTISNKPDSVISVNHTNVTNPDKLKTSIDVHKVNQPENSVDHKLSKTAEQPAVASTVAELSKEKQLNPRDPIRLQENVVQYDDGNLLRNAENDDEESGSGKSTFLMVLGVIPGLIGLIIAVGVVGIWMIQKNSTLTERSNVGNEPTTSSSQGKPVTLPCNI